METKNLTNDELEASLDLNTKQMCLALGDLFKELDDRSGTIHEARRYLARYRELYERERDLRTEAIRREMAGVL